MKISYNWLNIIQNYLLPPTCILCGNPGMAELDLCEPCYRHLPKHNKGCIQCADTIDTADPTATHCQRCLKLNPAFDKTYAPFVHQGATRHLITSLKFSAHYKNARLLGSLLADYLQTNADLPELILPIPLHKSRYYQRGFNQSIEIAKTVAQKLAIPLDLHSCVRHRDTGHQAALSAEKRRHNMKNAFSMIKPITAQHVAIIDDVMTTGSTVHELASVLKKSGVKKVDVWVCTRA